jgi:endonuclease III-like uncharacterized protein
MSGPLNLIQNAMKNLREIRNQSNLNNAQILQSSPKDQTRIAKPSGKYRDVHIRIKMDSEGHRKNQDILASISKFLSTILESQLDWFCYLFFSI